MSTSIKTPDENPSNVESILSDMNGLPGYTIDPPGSRIETLLIMMNGAFASSIVASIDENFVMSITLKNNKGETIGTTQTIDLPLESVIVSGSYDSTNKKLVFVLENGNTIDVPIGDLISGLQEEITSTNKLDADLVDDTNATNKFATAEQLSQIETNKTNILYNTDNGVKNLFNPSLQSTTGDHYTVIRNSDNTFTFTYDGHTSDRFVTLGTFRASKTSDYLYSQGAEGSTGTAILFIQIGSNYYYAATTGNGTVVPMTADSEYSIVCKLSAYSQGSWTLKPMLRLQGGSDYQPYAMSNVELTETTQQNETNISNEQAKTTGMTEGGSDYITVGGIRVYVSATAPTGARTGDLWIGG
jgi:hypothetical protein